MGKMKLQVHQKLDLGSERMVQVSALRCYVPGLSNNKFSDLVDQTGHRGHKARALGVDKR